MRTRSVSQILIIIQRIRNISGIITSDCKLCVFGIFEKQQDY